MPEKWIANKQMEIYMNARVNNHTQETSAAKSGVSERSGRSIESGARKAPHKMKRHWRTRQDPLSDVWESTLVPMLECNPSLLPMTLLEYLQATYPNRYADPILRTLQRRVKRWQALYGPEKEVIFRQNHPAGRQGFSDFTLLKQATITVAGYRFNHLLYHFRLAFSHWSYMKVIQGGESYTALAEGLKEALERLGGPPAEHRTDSLSAAYKNLNQEEQKDITHRYQELCDHYSMKATRNNKGVSHENGCIESPHGHLKRRIKQALLLRGSHDFESIETYQNFIDEVVQQHNRRNGKAITLERPLLQPLPIIAATDYTEVRAVVTSSSTIDVRKVTYTVPSRLQGEILLIHVYDNRLECYLGHQPIIHLNRVYPIGKTNRARLINYKHVIHSLVKKSGAFRYSQLRDNLLPSPAYNMIWTYVNQNMDLIHPYNDGFISASELL